MNNTDHNKTVYKVGGAGCGACILKIQNLIKPLTKMKDLTLVTNAMQK